MKLSAILFLCLAGGVLLFLYLSLWGFGVPDGLPIPYNPGMEGNGSIRRQPPPPGSLPYGEHAVPAIPPRLLYERKCAICHGTNGRASSYTAAHPDMPAVGDLASTDKQEDELRLIMMDGRGAMPAFASRLSEQAADALLAYILRQLRCTPDMPSEMP